jgi:hypothetical protein
MFKSLLAIVAVSALCTAPAKTQTLSDGEIVAIDETCAKLAAFEQARPENQPDAE